METVKKIKAVIYCRVSSREQEETGYSLPAQEKYLMEYASRPENDYDVVKVFQISESAGGKIKRKIFHEMMDYIRENEINVVIVETTDRLTRNFADVITIDAWVMDDEKNQIHLTKEGCVLHKNSKSHEWFMWRVKVATAEYYIRLLSENVQKGQKEKIAQGWLPTTPPLGYKTIGEKGHKIHVVDDEVAPYIKKMFELYASGNFSTQALGDKMYDLGFRSRSGGRVVKSKIHKLLCEPFYYGRFVWKGKEYAGKHEPIISRDLFEQVQKRMRRVSAPYHRTHLVELRGKINCGKCRKMVSWEHQKGRYYGSCKNCKAQLDEKKKYAEYDAVESQLLTHIGSIAPKNDKVLAVLEKALKESHSEEIAYHDAQVNGINASLERIQQRKRAMYDDRLDRRITTEFYDEKMNEFNSEEEVLTESLRKLKLDNTEYYKVGFSIHELALKAKDAYENEDATVEERRELLSYAFENVYVLKGEVEPEYTKGFAFLAKWMPKVNETFELAEKSAKSLISSGMAELVDEEKVENVKVEKIHLRTPKKPYVERQNATFVASHPIMLRRQDSNL